ALDHEAGDHAVERGAVVERALDPLADLGIPERPLATREADEVGHRDRSAVVEEVALEDTEARLHRRVQLALAGQALGRLGERELAARRIGRVRQARGLALGRLRRRRLDGLRCGRALFGTRLLLAEARLR